MSSGIASIARRRREGRRRAAAAHVRRHRRPPSCSARSRPRLAADAPRLPLRGGPQRRAGHLPEHAQPGRVVRALRHRLDRARTAASARLRFRMRKPGVPRRHDGDRAARSRAVEIDDTGCGWVELDVTMQVGDDDLQPTATARVADPDARRRQPLGPARRRAGSPDCEDATMDLDFTPEQDLLRETVARRVRSATAASTSSAQMEDDPVGYPDKFWAQLGELGLLGMTLPEEYGGSGMSMLDGVVVYQELGRALAPSPHFVSSVMSGGRHRSRPAPTRRRTSGSRDRRGRGDRHARLAGAAAAGSGPRASSCTRDRRRRRLAARRHQAPRAVRGRRRPRCSCSPAPTTAPTFFLVDPNADGRHADAADDDRVRHAVPSRLRRRARRRRRGRRRRR